MCRFFSCITKGDGHLLYFAWPDRQKRLRGQLTDAGGQGYGVDSHSSIADAHGLLDDDTNKYEYNPLTKEFRVDQLNVRDDSRAAKRACKKLDFSKIVPALIIQPIIHPFEKHRKRVSKADLALLKKWVSVWASVRDSVRYSVWASVRYSVWASVRDSVWDSVGASVRDSVGDSVWASAGDSVRASVWDSVGAYESSFYNIDKWKYVKHPKGGNPFQSCIDLWCRGLVPSFDGITWRLHAPQIVYEIAASDLRK